ncbi:MAG: PP2C family protein-serine/threonine phosphatase [Acidimicrobiales bacterium]
MSGLTQVLWGPDHTILDKTAEAVVGGRVALALTRGRHRKRYAYIDPNEDVVAAVTDTNRLMLVVADGHNGKESSVVAVQALVELARAGLPERVDSDRATELFLRLNDRVIEALGDPTCPNPTSRTTLAVALLTGPQLSWASLGDSAVFARHGELTIRLDEARRDRFLGERYSRRRMAAAMTSGTVQLGAGDHVYVASDGYTDYAANPLAWRGADGAGPDEIARDAVQRAFDGGAGDNVAVGVVRV